MSLFSDKHVQSYVLSANLLFVKTEFDFIFKNLNKKILQVLLWTGFKYSINEFVSNGPSIVII